MDIVLITNVMTAMVLYNLFFQVIYWSLSFLNKSISRFIIKRKLKKQLDHIDVNGGEVSD